MAAHCMYKAGQPAQARTLRVYDRSMGHAWATPRLILLDRQGSEASKAWGAWLRHSSLSRFIGAAATWPAGEAGAATSRPTRALVLAARRPASPPIVVVTRGRRAHAGDRFVPYRTRASQAAGRWGAVLLLPCAAALRAALDDETTHAARRGRAGRPGAKNKATCTAATYGQAFVPASAVPACLVVGRFCFMRTFQAHMFG
jgi:phage tail tape-measure protein